LGGRVPGRRGSGNSPDTPMGRSRLAVLRQPNLPDVTISYLTFMYDTRLTALGQQNRSVPWFIRYCLRAFAARVRSATEIMGGRQNRWFPSRPLGDVRRDRCSEPACARGLIRCHRGTFIFGQIQTLEKSHVSFALLQSHHRSEYPPDADRRLASRMVAELTLSTRRRRSRATASGYVNSP
jgi:hypothetical protein